MKKRILLLALILAAPVAFGQSEAPSMEERASDHGSYSRWSVMQSVLDNLSHYRGPVDTSYGMNPSRLAQEALRRSDGYTIGDFRCFETLNPTPILGAPTGVISTSRCVFDATYGESGHRCEVILADELQVVYVRCRLTAG